MANKNIVMLYNTDSALKVLEGLSIATVNKNKEDAVATTTIEEPSRTGVGNLTQSTPELKMSCIMCGMVFDNRNEQVEHFKSDWHRFNIKLKLKGRAPVDESKFEDITGGDISSISGSDTESTSSDSTDSEDNLTPSLQAFQVPRDRDKYRGFHSRQQKLFFQNSAGEVIALHRCILFGKRHQPESSETLIEEVLRFPTRMKWAIFMAAGGHFGGAIFDKDAVVNHKTFHRYVVRAKQGTAQSARDTKGNAPKSAGATLRRYNEAALTQEIQELVKSWKSDLDGCSRIFVRAPGFNNSIFFSSKDPLFDKNDSRIRSISIQTRRPTFSELKRIHKLLASVECYGSDIGSVIKSLLKPTQNIDENLCSEAVDAQTTQRDPVKETKPKQKHQTDEVLVPDDNGSEESESDDEVLSWKIENVTVETGPLKEFDCTRKPRRKKKKKTTTTSKDQQKTQLESEDFNLREIRDRLFTACKTGNMDAFDSILNELGDLYSSRLNSNGSEYSSNSQTNGVASDANSSAEINSSPDPPPQTFELTGFLSHYLSRPFGQQMNTMLHVAARSGHREIVKKLLENGADPTVRDTINQVPFVVANDKETKNEFRRFQALHPDKYDYVKAQVPGPLTEQMEKDKKQKMLEKKRIQKQAKKEKLKEEKLQEEKEKEEEKRRQAFLALSNRERHALAAEQRFKQQLQQQTGPSICRCWQCGFDISGKIPYEYYDFKFCSPSCLKEHKMQSIAKS